MISSFKSRKIVLKIILFLCFICFSSIGIADGGIGDVAENLMEPLSLISDFVNTGCFIIGGSFLFASLIKYIDHRRSPLMVPISTVIFLFIAGLALILLPFLAYVAEGGIKYSLLK